MTARRDSALLVLGIAGLLLSAEEFAKGRDGLGILNPFNLSGPSVLPIVSCIGWLLCACAALLAANVCRRGTANWTTPGALCAIAAGAIASAVREPLGIVIRDVVDRPLGFASTEAVWLLRMQALFEVAAWVLFALGALLGLIGMLRHGRRKWVAPWCFVLAGTVLVTTQYLVLSTFYVWQSIYFRVLLYRQWLDSLVAGIAVVGFLLIAIGVEAFGHAARADLTRNQRWALHLGALGILLLGEPSLIVFAVTTSQPSDSVVSALTSWVGVIPGIAWLSVAAGAFLGYRSSRSDTRASTPNAEQVSVSAAP